MRFGWHDAKRESNLAKHGLDFVDALACFADPDRLVWPDLRRDYGEERFNMLARRDGRVLHVTFTRRDGAIWFISARKANDRERRRYEQACI